MPRLVPDCARSSPSSSQHLISADDSTRSLTLPIRSHEQSGDTDEHGGEPVGKPDLPAIFLTARVNHADVQPGRSLGATYLTKPVVAQALLNAIRNASHAATTHFFVGLSHARG